MPKASDKRPQMESHNVLNLRNKTIVTPMVPRRNMFAKPLDLNKRNTNKKSETRISVNSPVCMPSLSELEKLYEGAEEELIPYHNDISTGADLNDDVVTSTPFKNTVDLITKKRKHTSTGTTKQKHTKTQDCTDIDNHVVPDIPMVECDLTANNNHTNISSNISSEMSGPDKLIDAADTHNVLDVVETYSDGSLDSNNTLTYSFSPKSLSNNTNNVFIPLPSTSRDHETYVANVLRFNDSIQSESSIMDVVELPSVTSIMERDINGVTYQEPSTQSNENRVECDIINVDSVISDNKLILQKFQNNCVNQTVSVKSNNRSDEIHKSSNERMCKLRVENINSIVENFFSNPNKENLITSDNNVPSVELQCISNIMTYLKECTHKIIDSFVNINSPRQSSEVINLDDIADTNDVSEEHSVTFISSTLPKKKKSHIVNTSVDDSVIFVSSTLNDNSEINPRRNTKKTKIYDNEKAVTKTTALPTHNIGICVVCLINLTESPELAATVCGHIFCKKCIHESIKKNGRRCPSCRKYLKGVGFHPLYL